jgi:putative transposase
LRTPELVIADGAPGLEKALAALWPDAPVQRCTVHTSTAISWLMPPSDEISNDYRDMI